MSTSRSMIRLHAAPIGVRKCEMALDELSTALVRQHVSASHDRGFAEGRLAAAREASALLDRAIERLEATRASLEEEATIWAVHFAVEIARHLVRREVEAGRHDIERIVRETLAQSGVGREPCVVHLSPEDVTALHGVPFRNGTVIEVDPMVARGEVHVTTAQGLFVREIDAILAALLERLTREAT